MVYGKYFSLLGASTSTFDGFSNSESYNSSIKENVPYYPKEGLLSDVNETWWMRTAEALGLRLCVNNSWSGSCVTTVVDGEEKAGCMRRATELHNDNLSIDPDIIFLIIGGNDALRGYEIGEYSGVEDIFDEREERYIGDTSLFGQAYATMVHKVKRRYPVSDIYLCSMLNWKPRRHNKSLTEYNGIIKKIADDFAVNYVDFYNETDISPEKEEKYFHTDGVHPNKYGFLEMAKLISRILRDRYGN